MVYIDGIDILIGPTSEIEPTYTGNLHWSYGNYKSLSKLSNISVVDKHEDVNKTNCACAPKHPPATKANVLLMRKTLHMYSITNVVYVTFGSLIGR